MVLGLVVPTHVGVILSTVVVSETVTGLSPRTWG